MSAWAEFLLHTICCAMVDTKTPNGYTEIKGDLYDFQAAINRFWEQTGMDTDTEEIRWILNWFDTDRRLEG